MARARIAVALFLALALVAASSIDATRVVPAGRVHSVPVFRIVSGQRRKTTSCLKMLPVAPASQNLMCYTLVYIAISIKQSGRCPTCDHRGFGGISAGLLLWRSTHTNSALLCCCAAETEMLPIGVAGRSLTQAKKSGNYGEGLLSQYAAAHLASIQSHRSSIYRTLPSTRPALSSLWEYYACMIVPERWGVWATRPASNESNTALQPFRHAALQPVECITPTFC